MATKSWSNITITRGVIQSKVVLDAGDASDNLPIANYPDKTVHIYGGSFGDSTVSLKGSNDSSATFENLHRTNDPTLNYSAVAAALLGHILENPLYLQASVGGSTGTGITVTVISSTPRG